MKAVILAGGIGSRMGDICKSIPKPLVELCGKPILLHQILTLKKEGVSDIIIITGYLSSMIESYFGDGSEYGVNISYYVEKKPLGTAGALFRLKLTEDFLLINGDLVFDIDISSVIGFHKDRQALATLLVHPNSHPADSTTLITDKESRITAFYKKNEKPELYPNLCNAGIQIVSPELLRRYNYKDKADFDTDVIAPAVNTKRVFAYKTAEYVHDAGTPQRLLKSEEDILSSLVSKRNKRNKQKAVFVDRDGTLNIHKGYITSPEAIELIPDTAKAINTLHALGYLVIVITNQPVVARGECTIDGLEKIHHRLEMLLSEKGAFVDGIYYCPHHPDKGFAGEVEELKIVCSCRKPDAGLILKAQKDFNIELSQSYMAGDSINDIKAGIKAGCIPVSLGSEGQDCSLKFPSLNAFARYLEAECRD